MKKNLKKFFIFSFILLFLFVGCDLKLSDKNKMSKEEVVGTINDVIVQDIKEQDVDDFIKSWIEPVIYATNRKSDLEELMAYYLFSLSAPDTLTKEQAFTLIEKDLTIEGSVSKDLDKYLNRNYSDLFNKILQYFEENPSETSIPGSVFDPWLEEITNEYENSSVELNPIPLKAYIDGKSYKAELDGISAAEISDIARDMYENVEIYYKEKSTSTTASIGKLKPVVEKYYEEESTIAGNILDFLSLSDIEILDSKFIFNNLIDGTLDDIIGGSNAEKLADITTLCNDNEGKELLDVEVGFKHNGNRFVVKLTANIKEEPVLNSYNDMDWVDVQWDIYSDATGKELKQFVYESIGIIFAGGFGN